MTSSSRLAGPSPSIANASPFVLTTPITLQYLTQFALHKEQLPTLVLADGSVYCGDLQSNAPVPHGIGIMLFRSNVALYQSNVVRRTRTVPALDTSSFSSGDRYGGSWVNGCFEGDGILITSTYTYQGSWSEGKPHGKGCMTYSKHYVDRMPGSGGFFDGALSALVMRSLSYISPFEDSGRKPREYMGDFHKVHLRHGTGMMKYYNGDVYEGEWVSNRRHGQGKLLRANGEVYTGQWVADERHGTGRIVYANGTIFKGTMVHDHRHGSGTMNFANGDEYVGNFNNDIIEGQGTMRYKNGDVYEGAWKDNTRHGLGKYTLKRNAVSVEGNFVHGLVHGEGTVNHPGLSTFVGRFDRGERTRGTIFWHDGPGRRGRRCYQGEWAGETMQGRGLMWFTNGDFYSGQFVKNRRTGLGNMRYADGAEYSGQFVQDQRHGWGIVQAEDGSIEAGRWSHDRFVEGYEGEWDGRALNGVGHLKLAVRTLLEADTVARASNTITTSVMSSSEESGMQGRNTATSAHVDTNDISREDDNEELVDFFGIFVDGRRDGMGVLKLPALLGLPQAAHSGSSSASKGMNSSSSGKKKNQSNKGRVKPHNVRRHVIKGCWCNDVLHCDRAVWAFPSGEVYIGGFVDGLRQGALGRLWLLDGSVFVGPWWQNAACGAGVYFAKNRRDPIYRRLASPPSKKSDAAADEVTTKATKQSSSSSAQGGTRFGLDALWRVFMAGHGSTRSRRRRHNRGRRGTRANTSSDDSDEEDNTTSSDGGGGGARLLRRCGRLLMGYRDHYYTTGTWCPVELSIAQYTTYIAPQIATQTPCLPAHLAPIKSWVNTATTTNINNTNGSIGLANNGIGMSGTLQDTGAIATPTSTPRLALRSQDVSSETSGQPRIEVKSKPPPFLLVGAKSGEGVTCYPSGLRVQMRWHGNYPALVSPYRPCSFYDVYLQWVKTIEDNLQSLPSLLGRSTTPCPSAQSVFTVKQLRPHAVADGWGPSATRRQLYSTSNHHSINESTDDTKSVSVEEQSVSTAATQCSFCGKLYGFFRKATQCTICLRSSCSSCLGGLEVDARPDVTALLRSSQALLQRIQTANTEEKNNNTETNREPEKAEEETKDEIQDLLQDRTLLVSSGQSLPVCGDCMRAVLQELRLATLSIPLSFFRSVLSPTQTEQTEVIHDLPLTAPPIRAVSDEQNITRDEGAMRTGEVVAALPFDLRVNEPTVSFVEPERCPAPSEEYMTPDENTNNSGGEAAADVIRALPEVIHNDTAPLSPLSPRGDRTPEFSRASRTLLSTPPTSSMLPEMMTTNAAAEEVNAGETAATAAEDTHTPHITNEDAIPDVPLTRNLTTNNALEKDMNVIYSGYTSHNVPHLWGRMWWGTRQYYEGGFQLGARHGYGTQYMSNGERYVGLFRNDEWDGPGCYFAEDGSALQGIFDHGSLRTVCYHGEVDAAMQRHGRGIGYEADGSTYNGEWQHGIRSGTGLMQAADGTLYAGQFRAGCAEGQGKLVTRRSAYYGSFRAGKKHGAGLEFYAECAVQGQWERGLQHGFCRIFDAATEEVYETTYRHGNERDDCFAPPIMVDDADCATCARCGAGFGLFLRRHHCRLCGEVFCDACSQHRATLPAHFFTTNTAATTTHIGNADDEDNSDSLASTQQQQQQQLLVTTPQRICDECFQRLEQRRMLALRRYADGAVYAGCWSQGRWVSRGLYCRPDGVCIVMNAHGKPLLPAHSTLGVTNTDTSSTPENNTGAILVDGSPTRAALDALPSGSSMRDVDAFVIWWASTSTRCRCRVLLDVPLLQRYYADQSQQQQQTQHATHQVEGETKEDETRSGRETSVERMSYPSIPDTPAPRLFVAVVNHDVTNTKDVITSNNESASVSAVSIDRDAAEAASLRAARFVPAIIPAPPVIDLNVDPILTCTSNKQYTSNNNGKEGENTSVLVLPPALEEYDLSDETMVRAIQEERQRRFRVASTTPKAEEEDNKETEGEQKNNDESNHEMQSGTILLRSRGHCPPLLPPTPAAPAEKSNDTIAWEAWATHPLPAICGCHFGPTPPLPLSTAQKEAGNNTPQEAQQQQGEDNNAQRGTAASLTSRTDKSTLTRSGAAPEEVFYYSCPLWCPVVPPVEEVLEQGKLQQAALLQQRYAQAVCEGKSNAHTPRNVQEEVDEGKKSENVMRGEGEKWLPAPLRGPFRFSIAVKDNGSASSERFVISQVCSEE